MSAGSGSDTGSYFDTPSLSLSDNSTTTDASGATQLDWWSGISNWLSNIGLSPSVATGQTDNTTPATVPDNSFSGFASNVGLSPITNIPGDVATGVDSAGTWLSNLGSSIGSGFSSAASSVGSALETFGIFLVIILALAIAALVTFAIVRAQ